MRNWYLLSGEHHGKPGAGGVAVHGERVLVAQLLHDRQEAQLHGARTAVSRTCRRHVGEDSQALQPCYSSNAVRPNEAFKWHLRSPEANTVLAMGYRYVTCSTMPTSRWPLPLPFASSA